MFLVPFLSRPCPFFHGSGIVDEHLVVVLTARLYTSCKTTQPLRRKEGGGHLRRRYSDECGLRVFDHEQGNFNAKKTLANFRSIVRDENRPLDCRDEGDAPASVRGLGRSTPHTSSNTICHLENL